LSEVPRAASAVGNGADPQVIRRLASLLVLTPLGLNFPFLPISSPVFKFF